MLVIETRDRQISNEIAKHADLVFNSYSGHIFHSTKEGDGGYRGKDYIYIILDLPNDISINFHTSNPEDYARLQIVMGAISSAEVARCEEKKAVLEREAIELRKHQSVELLNNWILKESQRRADWVAEQKRRWASHLQDDPKFFRNSAKMFRFGS